MNGKVCGYIVSRCSVFATLHELGLTFQALLADNGTVHVGGQTLDARQGSVKLIRFADRTRCAQSLATRRAEGTRRTYVTAAVAGVVSVLADLARDTVQYARTIQWLNRESACRAQLAGGLCSRISEGARGTFSTDDRARVRAEPKRARIA